MQFADYGILYVDDEGKSLKYFEAIFNQIAPIYTAQSPAEGFEVFRQNHDRIGLVLSDKKMPNESGLDLLRRMREYDPKPFRFLVTAFADLGVAVEALNDGLLYSYLTKPWDPESLERRLVEAMKHFVLAREREQLLEEKAEMLQQLVMADKAASIGILSTGLNHHLRNSLTVLRTFYDMLPFQVQEELGGMPKDASFWGDYYKEVGGQIERMTSMLSNLAEGTSRSVVEQRDPVVPTEVIQRAAEIVLEGRGGIGLALHADGEIPTISGDGQRLGQMFRLLFQEAKSAIRSHGSIEVQLSSNEGNGGIRAIILNDGDPIPDEDLDHLFDPFYVRMNKPEDIGTNLLACYLTAFHHGGTIRAFRAGDGRNGIEVILPSEPPAELAEFGKGGGSLSRFTSQHAVAKACDTVLPS